MSVKFVFNEQDDYTNPSWQQTWGLNFAISSDGLGSRH